ncbi:glycine zipper 2TM domain-containing protein [Sphingomonas parva]|uniref:17 kDa surface antigen n=1 Tax=Sphingomonas parva TaxID=2555898 RepID=A0A4Y8ZKK6_9SPHN|nr:glycine zipper 2TM domain-containing protein [Sphingomonas parva]TFI56550.1 glycine zipper 2TM domain-containing protein [Sphingomonas parva]
MLRKIALGTAAALTMASAVPAAADAHPRGRAHGYYNNSAHARAYYGNRYDQRRTAYRATRCRSGTTGAIVGGAAGALLGREIAGRGDRTLGTILGGAAGALGGRALTRDRNCR